MVLVDPADELKRSTSNKNRITSQPKLLLIPDKGRFLGDFPVGCWEEPLGEGVDMHCSKINNEFRRQVFESILGIHALRETTWRTIRLD